jgi:SAM-dependent methyltransferase
MNAAESDVIRELDKDSIRQNLRRFTWQAWHLVSAPPRPLILDLGCGSASAAVELAVMSGGTVTAVDPDRTVLARLREKAAALDLSARIRTAAAAVMRFRARPASFDVVWSEGAAAAAGFEPALARWRAFLKPAGFMVIHDEIRDRSRKLASLPGLGFEVVSHFVVPVDTWLTEYFRPLGERLHALADKYARRPDLLAVLRKEEAELEAFKAKPDDFASVFYVLRKGAPKQIQEE